MALLQFKLPDLGEGLTEGEILKWLVKPGDTIRLNQPLVEVETAKAAVEVPSPYAGVVAALHFGEGALVDVGVPIITVETEPGSAPIEVPGIPSALIANPPDDTAVEPGLIGGPAPGGRTSVLVGYGPKTVTAQRRPRKPGLTSAGPLPTPPPARVSAVAVGEHAARVVGEPSRGTAVLAKPPVRKFARDNGVDLRAVIGTGPSGTVTRADVESAARPAPVAPPAAALAAPRPASGETRIPIKGIRRTMAQAMVASAFTAPHVTVYVTADVTPTMELLDRIKALPEFAGIRVSPLLLVAKALLLAIRRQPLLNSSWDEAAQEIVVKEYVNLGIATATPRGLTVPNVKDAGRLALPDLARSLQDLADTARVGRTTPADLAGGTISITNVGVFGVDTGTPILNPGEAAILCLGAVRPMPWVHDGELAIRQVTQLGLSFDHRIVDGQGGAVFLADLARLLADPAMFTVWG
ncbi:MAG: dihydrolipoamide acetyltransferase family protein [Frankiaceae bacterium]